MRDNAGSPAHTHKKKRKTNDLTHKNQDKQANNSKTPLFSLKEQNEQVASNGDTQVKKKEVHQCPQLRVLVLIDNRRGFFTCDAHQIFLYQKNKSKRFFCVLEYLFSFALRSSQYFFLFLFVSLFNKDDTSIISKEKNSLTSHTQKSYSTTAKKQKKQITKRCQTQRNTCALEQLLDFSQRLSNFLSTPLRCASRQTPKHTTVTLIAQKQFSETKDSGASIEALVLP